MKGFIMRKMILLIMVMMAIVIASACVPPVNHEVEQDYFVLMLVCGGTYDSSDLRLGRFDNLDDAREWADSEMQGIWDIAYIYDSYPNDGDQRILWMRSESSCYPDMREWTRVD